MTHPAYIREKARRLSVESRLTIDEIAERPQHGRQDVEELRGFWSQRLDVEPTTVRVLLKSNSGQLRARQWRCRYGVIQVRASDTRPRARLQAWIDCVRAAWLQFA